MTESMSPASGVIACATLFADAKRKPVKSLNGITVDLLVSAHEFEGNTVLEGDVPDTALVIVKRGTLTVNGFVSGNVVAEGGVTIHGNAGGGYVISPRGPIKMEQALANSKIISMGSKVELAAAEHPHCVFGWSGVNVAGDVLGGRYLGERVTIGGTATGAEIHATGAMVVKAIALPPRGHAIICLRDEISCEEFGRPMGQDERRMRRSIGKHNYARNIMRRLIRYAERDIQDSYLTFLYMLLCSRLDPQKMSVMRGIQAQSNFLAENAAICELLIQSLSEAWKSPEAGREDFEPLAEYAVNSLSTISDDTTTMANAFRLHHKAFIVGCCDDVAKLILNVKRQPITKSLALSAIVKLRERKGRCEELQKELTVGLDDYVLSMGLDPNVARSVESQPHKAEAMLQTVRAQVEKDPQNPRYARTRSPLARLLQNTVDRSRKNIGSWRGTLVEAETQLKDVRQRLGANATTLFAESEPGITYLETDDCAAGVVIVGAPKDGLSPLESAATQVTVSNVINTPTRFNLHGFEIQRRVAPKE